MAKEKSFDTTNRKVREVYNQQVENASTIEKNNKRIQNEMLYASRIKQPKTLFDSGWVTHTSGITFFLINSFFKDTNATPISEGMAWPVEFVFEQEINISEKLLPFIKTDLLVKSSEVHKPKGLIIYDNVTDYVLGFAQVKGDSTVLYRGPRTQLSNVSQDDLDNGDIIIKYPSIEVVLRESDDSFKATLQSVEIVDIDHQSYGATNVSPDSDPGPIEEDQRTIIKGFTSVTTNSVTGKGIQTHETWSITGQDGVGRDIWEKTIEYTCETRVGNLSDNDHNFNFSGGTNAVAGDYLADSGDRLAWYDDCFLTQILGLGSTGINTNFLPERDSYPVEAQLPYNNIFYDIDTEEAYPEFIYEDDPSINQPIPSQIWGFTWLKLGENRFRLQTRGALFFSQPATEEVGFDGGREVVYGPNFADAVYVEESNNNNVRNFPTYAPSEFDIELRVIVSLLQPFTWQENRRYYQ